MYQSETIIVAKGTLPRLFSKNSNCVDSEGRLLRICEANHLVASSYMPSPPPAYVCANSQLVLFCFTFTSTHGCRLWPSVWVMRRLHACLGRSFSVGLVLPQQVQCLVTPQPAGNRYVRELSHDHQARTGQWNMWTWKSWGQPPRGSALGPLMCIYIHIYTHID